MGYNRKMLQKKLNVVVLLLKKVQPGRSIFVPHIRGVSAKFTRIAKRYNIKIVFKTSQTLRNSLIRIRPIRAPQKAADFMYSFLWECGRV